MSVISSRRAVPLVVLVLALAAAVSWTLRPASDAAPATARPAPSAEGTVTITGSGPGGDITLPVLSFSVGGTNSGGSVGGGRFHGSDVSLWLDASAADPLLLRAVATGSHFQRATISLSDGAQEWVLDGVIASSVQWSTNDKEGAVALTLAYSRIRLTADDGRGGSATTYCYDLEAHRSC